MSAVWISPIIAIDGTHRVEVRASGGGGFDVDPDYYAGTHEQADTTVIYPFPNRRRVGHSNALDKEPSHAR